MKLFRTYKVRLMPTDEQQNKFYRFNDACRFIWNTCLEIQMMLYNSDIKYITKSSIISGFKLFDKIFKELRNNSEEFKWLNDISRHTLMIKKNDMIKAYDIFIKYQDSVEFKNEYHKNRYIYKYHPRFKKKKENNIFTGT